METYSKVALFGGVYNNYLALECLLQDCEKVGVDAIFCLGDMGGFGPHPDRSFPSLRNGKIQSMAGNYDISLAQGKEDCGCGYTDPRDNHFAQISYEYTFENTSPENKSWLGTLPPSLRFALGPLSVELCHGSPRQTNEFLWESASPEHLLFKFTEVCSTDVVCCTHTGIKWHRALDRGRSFFNVGVIGRPENDGATNVWYTLLEHTEGKLKWDFRPLQYDHEALAKEMEAEGLPEPFITTIRSGWWTTCLEVMPAKERASGVF